jgi:Transposase DDE domain group 1
LSFWNGFYKEYCYTHLYLLADDGYPLGGVARAGNAGPAEGGLSMLANVVGQLRAKRKRMKIEYRADSAFTNPQTLDWCEQHRVIYFLGLAPNHALQMMIKDMVHKAREEYVALFGIPLPLHGKTWRQNEERIRFSSKEEGRRQELFQREQRVRLYGEVRYAARTWSRERRVIVRIDYTEHGEDVRFVVTNCETGSAKHIYDTKYCQRARCEMHIKELKSQRCDRLSCAEWLANQYTLSMHLFAYAMQIELRERLPSSQRSISTGTVRDRFLKIAAQIRSTTRGTRIRWSSSHPHQDQFRLLLFRLRSSA